MSAEATGWSGAEVLAGRTVDASEVRLPDSVDTQGNDLSPVADQSFGTALMASIGELVDVHNLPVSAGRWAAVVLVLGSTAVPLFYR